MSGSRKVPVSAIRKWAKKLGLGMEEVTVYVAAEQVPDVQTAKRLEQLRHWSDEAMSIISEPAHCEMLKLIRLTSFKPNCIWLSQQLGVNVDEVNIVLSRLLRLRRPAARSHLPEWKSDEPHPPPHRRHCRGPGHLVPDAEAHRTE